MPITEAGRRFLEEAESREKGVHTSERSERVSETSARAAGSRARTAVQNAVDNTPMANGQRLVRSMRYGARQFAGFVANAVDKQAEANAERKKNLSLSEMTRRCEKFANKYKSYIMSADKGHGGENFVKKAEMSVDSQGKEIYANDAEKRFADMTQWKSVKKYGLDTEMLRQCMENAINGTKSPKDPSDVYEQILFELDNPTETSEKSADTQQRRTFGEYLRDKFMDFRYGVQSLMNGQREISDRERIESQKKCLGRFMDKVDYYTNGLDTQKSNDRIESLVKSNRRAFKLHGFDVDDAAFTDQLRDLKLILNDTEPEKRNGVLTSFLTDSQRFMDTWSAEISAQKESIQENVYDDAISDYDLDHEDIGMESSEDPSDATSIPVDSEIVASYSVEHGRSGDEIWRDSITFYRSPDNELYREYDEGYMRETTISIVSEESMVNELKEAKDRESKNTAHEAYQSYDDVTVEKDYVSVDLSKIAEVDEKRRIIDEYVRNSDTALDFSKQPKRPEDLVKHNASFYQAAALRVLQQDNRNNKFKGLSDNENPLKLMQELYKANYPIYLDDGTLALGFDNSPMRTEQPSASAVDKTESQPEANTAPQQGELSAILAQLNDMKAQLEAQAQQLAKQNEQIAKQTKQISAQSKELKSARNEMTALKKENEDLKTMNSNLRNDLNSRGIGVPEQSNVSDSHASATFNDNAIADSNAASMDDIINAEFDEAAAAFGAAPRKSIGEAAGKQPRSVSVGTSTGPQDNSLTK